MKYPAGSIFPVFLLVGCTEGGSLLDVEFDRLLHAVNEVVLHVKQGKDRKADHEEQRQRELHACGLIFANKTK